MTTTSHGRIHWYESGELSPRARRVYDLITSGPRAQQAGPSTLRDERGRLHGPFNAMLIDPDVGEAVQALGVALRTPAALSARAREIAILSVAVAHKSEFEWYSHCISARTAGLSDADLVALRSGTSASSMSEEEQLVHLISEALVSDHDLDDSLYERGVQQLGLVALIDLVYLIGYYELIARSMSVFRTPLPDGAPTSFE